MNSFFLKIYYSFLVECTNSVYTEPNGGLISSPNYPGGYSDYINCTYLIDLRASSAQTVLLQLLDLQTEEAFDTVNVHIDLMLYIKYSYITQILWRSTMDRQLMTDYYWAPVGLLSLVQCSQAPVRCSSHLSRMVPYPTFTVGFQQCTQMEVHLVHLLVYYFYLFIFFAIRK